MMGHGRKAGTDESQWENVRVDRSCSYLKTKGSLIPFVVAHLGSDELPKY